MILAVYLLEAMGFFSPGLSSNFFKIFLQISFRGEVLKLPN